MLRQLPDDFVAPKETAVRLRCLQPAPVKDAATSDNVIRCTRPDGHGVELVENETIYHLAGYMVEGKPPLRWIAW